MIGSTTAAELDAISTARIAGRCRPPNAASRGAMAIEMATTTPDAISPAPGGAAYTVFSQRQFRSRR